MYCNRDRNFIFWIMVSLAAVFAVFMASCAHANIPFQVDIGLSSSGEVNSYEHTIVVQGKPCPGACVIQHVRNVNLSLLTIPRPYSYTFDLQCSNNISFKKDIESNKQFSLSISPPKFDGINEFDCIATISPHDRVDPITSKFRLFVLLVDPVNAAGLPFMRREEIYWDGKSIILGRYALYTSALTDTGKFIKLSKQTTMDWPKGAKRVCIETESFKQRYNYSCLQI